MDYNPDEYPVAITLRFKSKQEKDFFLGGLSDGWGENYVGLAWDTSLGKAFVDPFEGEDGSNLSFFVNDTFLVDPFHEGNEEKDDANTD